MEGTSSKQKNQMSHHKISARNNQDLNRKKRLDNILRYREKILGQKLSPELKKAYLLKMKQNG
ncbi:MAG: hypothetical protein J6W11_01300 [Alphaproteobacteria bacterium]|nr:hypothetical protein [Alphaproteobacteria bacterium]